jgi:hypothetical protein
MASVTLAKLMPPKIYEATRATDASGAVMKGAEIDKTRKARK